MKAQETLTYSTTEMQRANTARALTTLLSQPRTMAVAAQSTVEALEGVSGLLLVVVVLIIVVLLLTSGSAGG